MVNQDRGIYSFVPVRSKKYFKYKKQAIILLGVAVLLLGFKATKIKIDVVLTQYGFITTSSDLITGDVGDELFKLYIDKYNFYCAIPVSYTVGGSCGGDNRLALKSPDGKTLLFLGAKLKKMDLSAEKLMKQYIVEFPGDKVDYYAFNNEKGWYAVSKINGNTFYYRKCFVYSQMILWFDFNVEAGSKEPLQTYIEYIEDHFKMPPKSYYTLLWQVVANAFKTITQL